jgi:hypothetical protein
MTHISQSRVAVVTTTELQPMEICPVGVKVQLMNPGGVLVYGSISESSRQEYLAWHGLPKRPQWLIEKMNPVRKP